MKVLDFLTEYLCMYCVYDKETDKWQDLDTGEYNLSFNNDGDIISYYINKSKNKTSQLTNLNNLKKI